MKKIFISLVFLSLSVTSKLNAQVPDTLAYLNSIENNKVFFIGKSFSVLLDSLKIQIKYFSPTRGIVYDISKETSTHFGFRFPQNADDMYLTYPHLVIYWQPCLNATQSDILWENNNGGEWSSAVAAFYSTGKIADIKVRE